ncbi:MAG TPA: hypothetical protein VHB21_21715 [Minicystis sp.]|nr:hypothetical protein [Minicystis sp.]
MRISAGTALVVLIALGVAGCGKKTPECNAIVEVVNGFGETAKLAQGGDATAHAAALEHVAAADDKAAGDLAAIKTTIPELGAFSQRFQRAFKDHAAASRDLRGLLAKLPDAKAEKALEDKIAASREAMDVAERALTKRCEDEPAACESFAPLLKKQPDPDAIDANDAAKTKAWAAGVDAWSAEIAKTPVKDAEAKQDLAKLTRGLKDLASVVVSLSEMSADSPRRDAAHDAQEKAAKQIGALVDELNTVCPAP